MHTISKLAATFVAVLTVVPGLIRAQELPSAAHLTLVQRGTFLLLNPAVRAKLGVSLSKVQPLFDSYAKQQDVLYRSARPDEASIRRLDLDVSNRLLATLSRVQVKKLRAMAFERAGARALIATEVVLALKLTNAQRVQIETILERASEAEVQLEQHVSARLASVSDAGERATIQREYAPERARLKALRAQTEMKAFAVLSPAQRKTFDGLRR